MTRIPVLFTPVAPFVTPVDARWMVQVSVLTARPPTLFEQLEDMGEAMNKMAREIGAAFLPVMQNAGRALGEFARTLSERDTAFLQEYLAHPQQPNEALKAAAKKYWNQTR